MVRAIEDSFPIRTISQLAERESWRKEIYRPTYYVHKWWARRLGSVFRGIILASCAEQDQEIESLFYQPVRFPDVVVFDPFMGSGTTIGEAVKLGCRAIGRDINPVSVGMVTAALHAYSRDDVRTVFKQIEASAASQIRSFYRTRLPTGADGEVLYYFWVKTVPCPHCHHQVELFKSRVFAKHAYPKRHPGAKSICPHCGCIDDIEYNQQAATCSCCKSTYNPQSGAVNGATVTCPLCHQDFKTIDAVRRTGSPPDHKLYAKMVLTPSGDKVYLQADEQDLDSYSKAEQMLPGLWDYVPQEHIMPGYNTNQVLNYNYVYWHQMFNARQLATIALLVREVRRISHPRLQMLFAFLLSGCLEFNNMFCSFKGEGTGAVRHMFSHHILKPELTPMEANLWGTPKSSGSFSTLFESRILRALDYKDNPFELKLVNDEGKLRSEKALGISQPLEERVVSSYAEFCQTPSVYLSCGDSSTTDLPPGSVDLVITDPPFFDNVHYSQLADFFHVWLRLMLQEHDDFVDPSTRSPQEVQDTDEEGFTQKLTSVLCECNRVLTDDGLLVLTYHHSRVEGWTSIYKAIRDGGFHIVRTHPVKAEMAVSVPIQQSKSPVHFDLILVCRKSPLSVPAADYDVVPLLSCLSEAASVVRDIRSAGIEVSLGDIKVMVMGSILSRLAALNDPGNEVSTIRKLDRQVDGLAEQILRETESPTAPSAMDELPSVGASYEIQTAPVYEQLKLLLEALDQDYSGHGV
jgi:putative DNA methylase